MPRTSPDLLDFGKLVKEAKRLAPDPSWAPLRIAHLGNCALQYWTPLFRALFARASVAAEVYEGEFDTTDVEVHDPASRLYAFGPQVVVLVEAVQHLRDAFFASDAERESFAARIVDRIVARWDAIAGKSDAIIVQTNFPLPLERAFGNYERKVPTSLTSTIAEINRLLEARAREHKSVFLVDVEHLAGYVGRRSFFDDKLWVMGKVFCAFDHLPLVVQNVVDVALASRGVGVKCVVLDLDNTVWGGIVGDDGMDGIRIGHLGDGEAFLELQRFMLELTRRGILLTVCSKNDHANAIQPFREHAEMVLREKDVTMFVANWDDKAKNIALIKETLNIGYDSMVFLDDNPFERNLVRELLPEVIVPELPEDPAEYVRTVNALNLFETSSFSDLDRKRVELYKGAAQREETKRKFENVDQYLQSLEMEVDLRRFTTADLPRIAQLIQRSNQFNLATRRYSERECAAFMDDPTYEALAVSLRDRFGDYGLISVVVARTDARAVFIDEYIMSCRVLQRGVEQYVMNHLFARARERGLARVEGLYVPTKKNGMVAHFYEGFGFARVDGDAAPADGPSPSGVRWSLAVSDYVPRETHLRPLGQ
jgi:FkbH-like protein